MLLANPGLFLIVYVIGFTQPDVQVLHIVEDGSLRKSYVASKEKTDVEHAKEP